MELTGNLSDFALADILQIMALSRKTGTILLETGEHRGRILLHQGRITHASASCVESLSERIARRKGIRPEIIQELIDIGSKSDGVWGFDTLIIESGILGDRDLKAEVRGHIRSVLAGLIGLHKGQFNIVLNQATIPESYREAVLASGLDVSEILIDAARHSDELKRNENGGGATSQDDGTEDYIDEDSEEEYLESASQGPPSDNGGIFPDLTSLSKLSNLSDGLESGHYSERLARFCSLLGELNGNTSESEITLMLMRYASELVSRGILFSVGKAELNGLGQFGLGSAGGVNSRNSDLLVRNMRIPLTSQCLLSSIAKTPRPAVEKIRESFLDEEMLRAIGGRDRDLTVLVVPLVCEGRVNFLLYGDNFPDENPIEGIEELFVFARLASLVLEKIRLEEKISLLRSHVQVTGAQVI
ncbi:MAG: DUF4388 domain-containing protein [Blastocatellia bacterium]